MPNTKKVASKKSSTSTKKTASKSTKKPAASVQRNYLDPSLKIVKKINTNPRRENSWGYQSFALIKTGMTVEQFTKKGGRLRDLHWDMEHGYVELKKVA